MIKDCKICGITFDSEGHELGEDLTLCSFCNSERTVGLMEDNQ